MAGHGYHPVKSLCIAEGAGRAAVHLSTQCIGDDLVVFLFNEQGHLGAVAVADYSVAESRASTSIITRLGHKDDKVAGDAAHRICKFLKKPVCVIAGIHLDNITEEEITQIIRNCETLVQSAIDSLLAADCGLSTAD
jgi:gallate decarboxylase subunit D